MNGVGAPDEDDLGVVVVHGLRAMQPYAAADSAVGAVAEGLVVAGVDLGRAQRIGEAVDHALNAVDEAVVAGAGIDDDRLIAVGLLGLHELFGDGGDGLIPGDALPLVLAALADALHRVLDAVGAVGALRQGQALEAAAGVVVVGVGLRGHHGDLAVAHVRVQRTGLKAVGAAGGVVELLLARGFRRSGFQRALGDRAGSHGQHGRRHRASLEELTPVHLGVQRIH